MNNHWSESKICKRYWSFREHKDEYYGHEGFYRYLIKFVDEITYEEFQEFLNARELHEIDRITLNKAMNEKRKKLLKLWTE